MKKLFIISFVSLVFISLSAFQNTNKFELEIDDEYKSGWIDGHCEGWKDVKGQFAICPVAPVCPVSEIECSEGYKCGYNRGFKAGRKAAKE